MWSNVKSIKLPEVQLPSNSKFGIFFTSVFVVVALYFFINDSYNIAIPSIVISLILLIITMFRPDILLPINKAWMSIGLILGVVVSPIVLGVIFFGLFTPISLAMRILRRDELRLKLQDRESYWVAIGKTERKNSEFKQQF